MEKIVVNIDPDLADLIPSYLENRKEDIASIQAGLEKNNFEGIKITGHSMKGSGGGYGFDEISRIGADIESAAKASDREQIKTSVTQLGNYLSVVEVKY